MTFDLVTLRELLRRGAVLREEMERVRLDSVDAQQFLHAFPTETTAMYRACEYAEQHPDWDRELSRAEAMVMEIATALGALGFRRSRPALEKRCNGNGTAS